MECIHLLNYLTGDLMLHFTQKDNMIMQIEIITGKGWFSLDEKEFALNDIVEMKKQHPCGANRWKIIRIGMDIRIKCEGCGHSVMLQRKEFMKKMKKPIERHEAS